MKNPDGPPPKGAGKAKPASKAAPKKAAKRVDDDGGDNDDEEADEEVVASSGKSIPELLLANKWDLEKGPDPTGWWISEKLDGVR
jgi:DNA ligase-1